MDASDNVGELYALRQLLRDPDIRDSISKQYWYAVRAGLDPTKPGSLEELSKEVSGGNSALQGAILRLWGVR